MKKKTLIMFTCLLFLLLGTVPISAAEKKQVALAKRMDSFVFIVLGQARMQALGSQDAATYKAAVKKIYKGSLTKQQKAIIAAHNTTGYKKLSGKDFVEKTSLSRVKTTYKNLFGVSVKNLSLPKVKNPAAETGYVMDIAMKGSSVYMLTYPSESAMDVKQVSLKKSGSSWIVTRKYSYYSYWGRKMNGYAPEITVTAKITVKKSSKSSFGYKITGFTLK